MNDSEILQMIRENPSKGHRALFDEYYNYVYAIALNNLRNVGTKDDIEDCVIDSFTDILLNVDTDRADTLKSYIGTVVKNKSISAYRSLKKRRGDFSLDDEESQDIASKEDVAAKAENNALAAQLLDHIRALGEPDSEIIIHKYFYERNSAEIAAITGLSPAAVRLRCSRALKRLREKFTKDHTAKESA